ncbi:MAG: Ribosomal RNA small subunit methyltransferase D [Verrucomicrobiae bacterium]|nr:Ribosomal RNA small subunit methyltransferase D [Verrucomicrobiae bacterium]
MRIIAGIAKGMVLAVPRGADTRPTSDRVREAIFSSLGARVVDADVLDLYAGTGALGLEAASRGARSVVLVERARQALECIATNLAGFRKQRGELPVIEVQRGEVGRVMGRLGRQFNLVFADPPYAEDPAPLLAGLVAHAVLAPAGWLVLETGRRSAFRLGELWQIEREAVYGDTVVRFLRVLRQGG